MIRRQDVCDCNSRNGSAVNAKDGPSTRAKVGILLLACAHEPMTNASILGCRPSRSDGTCCGMVEFCVVRCPLGQRMCSTSPSGRRGVRTGSGVILGCAADADQHLRFGAASVSRRTVSRLACTSIMWVKVQVAKPAAVHSRSTRESASPHRSVLSRLSS